MGGRGGFAFEMGAREVGYAPSGGSKKIVGWGHPPHTLSPLWETLIYIPTVLYF